MILEVMTINRGTAKPAAAVHGREAKSIEVEIGGCIQKLAALYPFVSSVIFIVMLCSFTQSLAALT